MNVLVKDVKKDADGDLLSMVVMITDFGLSRQILEGQERQKRLTVVPGTLGWTAPEVRSSTKYDVRADVWSFGNLNLWLLCGPDSASKQVGGLLKLLKDQNPDAHDLICGMRETEPAKRISLYDATKAKWYTKDKVLVHPENDPKLRAFHHEWSQAKLEGEQKKQNAAVVEDLHGKIKKLKERIKGRDGKIKDLKAATKDLEARVNGPRDAIEDRVGGTISNLNVEIEDRDCKIKDLEAAIGEQKETINQLTKAQAAKQAEVVSLQAEVFSLQTEVDVLRAEKDARMPADGSPDNQESGQTDEGLPNSSGEVRGGMGARGTSLWSSEDAGSAGYGDEYYLNVSDSGYANTNYLRDYACNTGANIEIRRLGDGLGWCPILGDDDGDTLSPPAARQADLCLMTVNESSGSDSSLLKSLSSPDPDGSTETPEKAKRRSPLVDIIRKTLSPNSKKGYIRAPDSDQSCTEMPDEAKGTKKTGRQSPLPLIARKLSKLRSPKAKKRSLARGLPEKVFPLEMIIIAVAWEVFSGPKPSSARFSSEEIESICKTAEKYCKNFDLSLQEFENKVNSMEMDLFTCLRSPPAGASGTGKKEIWEKLEERSLTFAVSNVLKGRDGTSNMSTFEFCTEDLEAIVKYIEKHQPAACYLSDNHKKASPLRSKLDDMKNNGLFD